MSVTKADVRGELIRARRREDRILYGALTFGLACGLVMVVAFIWAIVKFTLHFTGHGCS